MNKVKQSLRSDDLKDSEESSNEVEKDQKDEELVWEEKEKEESEVQEEDEKEEEEEEMDDENEAGDDEEEDESKESQPDQTESDQPLAEDGSPLDEDEPEESDEGRSVNEDIARSDILRKDLNQFVRDNQPSYSLNSQDRKSSGKLVTLFLFIVAVAVIGGGIYFFAGLGGSGKTTPTPSPAPGATPSPTPKPLNRSEWSFEILNGSPVTGEAKKIADKLKALGYPVVKTANADKDTYTSNQFFVKKELEDSVDLVVTDIKDIIKIASISGELKDSTASARIIIGK